MFVSACGMYCTSMKILLWYYELWLIYNTEGNVLHHHDQTIGLSLKYFFAVYTLIAQTWKHFIGLARSILNLCLVIILVVISRLTALKLRIE